MKRIIIFILLLLVALIGLSFALLNADTVTLNYYFDKLQAPLSLIMVIALALGAVMGVLASMWVVITQKREMAKSAIGNCCLIMLGFLFLTRM